MGELPYRAGRPVHHLHRTVRQPRGQSARTSACAAQPRRAGWQHQRGWREGHDVQEAHTCKECNKLGGRGGALNSDQLHGKCVAVFKKKQKAKKDNGGFAPIWVPDALRKRKRDDHDNDTDPGGGGAGGSSRFPMGALVT